MRWTRVGLIGGVVFFAFILVVIAAGNSPLQAPLIALVALLVLVAGGNWLNSWLGIKRKAQEFNRPDRSAVDQEDGKGEAQAEQHGSESS